MRHVVDYASALVRQQHLERVAVRSAIDMFVLWQQFEALDDRVELFKMAIELLSDVVISRIMMRTQVAVRRLTRWFYMVPSRLFAIASIMRCNHAAEARW